MELGQRGLSREQLIKSQKINKEVSRGEKGKGRGEGREEQRRGERGGRD